MNNTIKGYLFALISALTYGMIPLFMIPLKKMSNFSIDTALFYRFFYFNLPLLSKRKLKNQYKRVSNNGDIGGVLLFIL